MAARPPGLVFYVAGADPHEGDRLGRLKLTHGRPGRARRDRAATRCASAASRRVVLMAGGYGHVVDDDGGRAPADAAHRRARAGGMGPRQRGVSRRRSQWLR